MSKKHTMRLSVHAHYSLPLDLTISEVVRHSVTHDDGSKEVAISSVDLLLDDTDNFILNDPKDNNCRIVCKNANLNKNNLWETVLEELENTCISKSERANKHHELGETVYTVPVVGHKVFLPSSTNEDFELGAYHEIRVPRLGDPVAHERLNKSTVKKIKLNPAQFMYWEGKYYDVTKIYSYKAEQKSLKPVGNCNASKPSIVTDTNLVEFTRNIHFHNAMHKRVNQECRIQHQGAGSTLWLYGYRNGSGGWEQKVQNDYLEIDLGYPRSVTHIGTAGEIPATSVFPSRRVVGERRLRYFREENDGLETQLLVRNGNGVRTTKFASHVRILKENELSLCWVTSYEVHYRHAVTNKWTLLTVTSANTDAFSEHLLDLSPYFNAKDGLFTQYLRIKPVDYHHRPVMRVAVYGVDSKHSHCDRKEATIGKKHNKNDDTFVPESESQTSSDDVPTISYTIIHSSPRAGPIYVRDGLRNFYKSIRRYYYESDRPRATKRKNFQGTMVDYNRTGWADLHLFFGIDYKDK